MTARQTCSPETVAEVGAVEAAPEPDVEAASAEAVDEAASPPSTSPSPSTEPPVEPSRSPSRRRRPHEPIMPTGEAGPEPGADLAAAAIVADAYAATAEADRSRPVAGDGSGPARTSTPELDAYRTRAAAALAAIAASRPAAVAATEAGRASRQSPDRRRADA